MNTPLIWAFGKVPSLTDLWRFCAHFSDRMLFSQSLRAQHKLPAIIHQPLAERAVSSGYRLSARLSGFGLAASLSWFEAGSQAVTLMFKGLANWYVRVAYQLRNNILHSKVMSSETNLAVIIFLIKTEVDILYCKKCSNYFSICFD